MILPGGLLPSGLLPGAAGLASGELVALRTTRAASFITAGATSAIFARATPSASFEQAEAIVTRP